MELTPKICLSCGKPVKGRSDKKFCDDYCRNSYNNQLKMVESPVVKNVNNALKKNRTILATLLPEGQDNSKVGREKLTGLGFQFKYFTHQYITKKGTIYCFCYDYGYLQMEHDWFLIVRDKD